MFLYQINGDAIRILGCRSYDGVVEIPEKIDGRPVTELAPYAFSEGWGRKEMLTAAGSDILLADSEGNPLPVHHDGAGNTQSELELPPVACCDHLTEIILPGTIKKIGNYAFYNCFELKTVRCYSSVADVGSGVFTGCTGVRLLDIQIVGHGRSCFKEVISELRQELYVNYYSEEGQAKLVFPEMFEESVENTPARIIMREMHGCGHRYRYCFEQTQFQFARYDMLFPHILVQEPERVVAMLVMGRLWKPLGLKTQYRETYEAYLREHMKGAAKAALDNREEELFVWLAETYGDTREAIDGLTEVTGQAGKTELTGYLMDLKHRRFSARKRTFSLE